MSVVFNVFDFVRKLLNISGCFQVFILNVPPRLAAVWFGADQVSSACSIGVFGNQVRYLPSLSFHKTYIHWNMNNIDIYLYVLFC